MIVGIAVLIAVFAIFWLLNLNKKITTVDSAGDVGKDTSIAIGTDGLPVISYYDVDRGDLKVVKCFSNSCK